MTSTLPQREAVARIKEQIASLIREDASIDIHFDITNADHMADDIMALVSSLQDRWRLIDDDPPKERFVLVATEKWGTVEAIRYVKGGWITFGCNGGLNIEPYAWMEKPAALSSAPVSGGGEPETIDEGLWEWLKERDLQPDHEADGTVDWLDIVNALSEHENELVADAERWRDRAQLAEHRLAALERHLSSKSK